MGRGRIERLHTYSRPITSVQIPDRLAGFELLPATPELLEEFHAKSPQFLNERKRRIMADRLRGQEERVFFARDSTGALVGWCHLIRGSGPDTWINHTLRLRPDDAFLFDDAVARRYRRRGIHTFMILRRLQLAQEEGCTRAVTNIADSNTASIASFKALGFAPRSNLVWVRAVNRAIELPLAPQWLRRLRRAR